MEKTLEPTEDPSKNFKKVVEGNVIKISWRNSFILYAISIFLGAINLALLVNGHRIPPTLIIASALIILLLGIATRHQLLITPEFIKYKGGFLAPFGITIENSAIKVIAYQYKMSDDPDSDSEYVLYLVLDNGRRVRISNRLNIAEVKWLLKEVAVHNPEKIATRYEFPSGFFRFVEAYEFPLSLLLAVVIGTAAWLGPSEEDIDVSDRTLMLFGWIGYCVSVGICLQRTKHSKTPISFSTKLFYALLSTFFYTALFYWRFF
jgi:hypothetical protein